jgi:amino acid adenylation domain-containing protein
MATINPWALTANNMSSDTVTVETFIARLREAGIELGAEAGNLRVSALPGAFTAEIREQVTRRKRELLLYLAEHANPEPASDACIGRASREGPLPLSFAEKGLWLVDQIYPGSAAFNWSVAVRLTGSLDIPALTRSINEILRRHEVLRTTVTVVDGEPGRVLHSSAEMAIPLVTLSEAPDAAREDELQRQVRELAGTGFDLSQGPLIRARLWRMSEREHVLLIVTHHIVSDGWSLGVIGRELEVLYRCFARDETAALPELAVQYADYAVWQREWVESEEFKHKLAFWREQLAGAPALIELPTDRPRPAARSLRGGVVSELLPPALLARLEALGRQEGATLFMMLLAAFNVLLRRYTRQDDLVVGTPVANRTRPELEPLIGFFVNLLPLRARFTGDPTFRAYLHELRASTVQAFAHQDMPFDKLVEDLHPNRTLGHTALFQVFFTLQKEWENSIQLGPDLLVTPMSIERGTSQYDLSLYAQTSRDGLRLAFEYSADLFERETISSMLAHFGRLLEGIVADPDRRLWELPLFSKAERPQMVARFNPGPREYPRERTVVSLIEEQAARRPEAVAVSFEGATLTYAELEARARRLGRHLQRLGVGAESLVGLCLERGLEMVVGVLGVLKAGGAYVPLDPAFPAERLGYMLADSGAKVLVSQTKLGETLFGQATVQRVYMDRDAVLIDEHSAEALAVQAKAGDRAYVLYTSGSTGRPKGVNIEHRSLTNFLCSMMREPGIEEHDVLLAVTTLSFDIAGLELFLPLIAGARLELASRQTAVDGAALARALAASGTTVMQATPTTWRMLFESGWQGDRRLKVLCGGESLGRDLAARLASACGTVWNMYGPTETTIWSSVARIDSDQVTIGRPIANTWMYVLDAHGEPVPRGVVGELWIGGDGVARGYLNRPELTVERFARDPFRGEGRMYRTGDLARQLPDGRLECLGRNDDQIKIRGYRIETGEIESVLGELPQVTECAVVARTVGADEKLVAYVAGSGVSAESCREHLRGRLPDYMVPSIFVSLPALPRTPNNKVDRKALPQPESSGLPPRTQYMAPRTQVERIAADIWCEVLGVERVGVFDSFFEMGGHSLLATRLIARLNSAFGIELPLRNIFTEPTVAGMSKHIEFDALTQKYRYLSETHRWSRLIPAQPNGSHIPLFMVAGYVGADDTLLLVSNLIPHLGPDQPVYGFQPRWLDGHSEPYSSVDEVVREFLAELRVAQPKGPYQLGGHCVGGVIALEMARELIRQGEEVRLLVMVDTDRPNALRGLMMESAALGRRARHIMQVIRTILGSDHRTRMRLIRDLGRRKLQTARPKPAGELPFDRAYRLAAGYRKLIYRHRPKKYPGRITLVVNETQYRFDKKMGWGGMAEGGLETHCTPGDHWTHVNLHSKGLAERIRACLEQAEAADSRRLARAGDLTA